MQQVKFLMSSDQNSKLVGLFFGALIIFTFPMIQIFGKEGFVFGVPVLYVYIFVVWLAVILLIRQIFKKKK